MKRSLTILLVLSLLTCSLAGCGETNEHGGSEANNEITLTGSNTDTPNTEQEPSDEVLSLTDGDMFTDRDVKTDYDESKSVLIQLNGTSAAASSDSVNISGTTLTITEEATYIISGTLDDGMIIVDAPDTAKLQIVLNAVDITCKTSAPLYIKEADKVFLILADGTENTLSNGGTFTAIDENDIDAAVFSKQDLTLNGSGALTVISPAGHGIVCKDDLVLTGGTYTVDSASHGLDANDSVRITGETDLTIDAGKDGIHSENTDDTSLGFVYISNGTMNIDAQGDGIDATSDVTIYDGTINIKTNGVPISGSDTSQSGTNASRGGMMMAPSIDVEFESSSKGINTDAVLSVYGGEIAVEAASHCIHSEGEMVITGGLFRLSSTYEKGISAHGDLTIDGENTVIDVTKATEGIESKTVMTINNGTITVIASDDALNATGGNEIPVVGGNRGSMGGNQTDCLIINGGYIEVYSNYDCLDSNGNLVLNGGVIKASNTGGAFTGQNSVFDPDGKLTIGDTVTFISTSGGKTQANVSTTQHTITIFGDSTYKAETYISVKDETGTLIAEYVPHGDFNSFLIISPALEIGKTYTIAIGDDTHEVTLNEHNTVVGTEEASNGMDGFGAGGMGMPPGAGMLPDGSTRPFSGGNGEMGGNFPWQNTAPSETKERQKAEIISELRQR